VATCIISLLNIGDTIKKLTSPDTTINIQAEPISLLAEMMVLSSFYDCQGIEIIGL